MDLTQIILISTIVILAIFLILIGFQAFFVLKELRKTVKKTNRLLDSSDELVTDVRKPIETIEDVIGAISGRKLGYLLGARSSIRIGKDHALSTFMAGFVLSEALTHLFGLDAAARLKKEILKEGGNLLEDVKEKVAASEPRPEGREEAGEKIEEKTKEVKEKAQAAKGEPRPEEREKVEEIKQSEHPPNKLRRFFFRKPRAES